MRWDDFEAALYEMEGQDGLILPHGVCPHVESGSDVDEAMWVSISWNPPTTQDGHILPIDEAASQKPDFSTVVSVANKMKYKLVFGELKILLHQEATKEIIHAYGANNRDDEINMRLRGSTGPDQDAERDRLRSRYKAVKAEIETATDQSTLDAIKVKIEDGTWANEPATS